MINHKTYDSHIWDLVLDSEELDEDLLEELIERDEKIEETYSD